MYELLLFLYGNNFFHYANFLSICVFAFAIWKSKSKLLIPKSFDFFLIFFASLSYIFICAKNFGRLASSSLFLQGFAPWIMFYCGYWRGKVSVDLVKKDTLICTYATFFHGLLNLINTRGVSILLLSGRPFNDIYGGTLSATNQNLLWVMSSALLFYFLVCEKNRKIKLAGILAVLISLYGTIFSASRTVIYVILILFLCSLLMYQYLKHGLSSGIMRWMGIAIGIAITVLIIVWLDAFHVQEWFASTALGMRNSSKSIIDNSRWTYATDILKLLPSYPMGNIPYAHYAHNLWLDIARDAGIIPFALYVLFTLFSLVRVVRFVKSEGFTISTKLLIIPVWLALLLVSFTEPIMEGAPMIYALFCYISGGISSRTSYVSKYARQKNRY